VKQETYESILITFFGMSGSILTGLIFFGATIFSPHSNNFMFVSAGLYGSVFFSLLEYESRKTQVFGMIIVFFLNIVLFQGRSIGINLILRDLLWLGGLFASVKLYHLFIKRNPGIKFYLRSLALVLFFGILSAASGLILYVINIGKLPRIEFLYLMGRFGVLIGFGVGIGIDFYLQNKKHLFNLLKIKTI
jgi:hypothetical protein